MLHTLTNLPGVRLMTAQTDALRARLRGIDPGTATVKFVAAGLVLGTAAAVLTDLTARPTFSTTAELVARIAPVGSVSTINP